MWPISKIKGANEALNLKNHRREKFAHLRQLSNFSLVALLGQENFAEDRNNFGKKKKKK